MTGKITVSGSLMNARIEWKISHYFGRNEDILSSSIFDIFNCRCVLRIHPERFLCMRLIKCSGSEIIVECIMGIKKSDGSETRTEKIESLLGRGDSTDKLPLIATEDLNRSRDTVAHDSSLTVFCNVHLIEVISDPVVNILSPSLRGIAADGDSVANEALSTLFENLKDLYFRKCNTDVIFKVKDKEFSVHKLILIARSEVFAAMLEHDMSEKRSGIVEITDCDPDSFEDFLLFLYTADVKIVSSRNVVGLYKTSDKYGCKELLKQCVRYMDHLMSTDTFFDYLTLATMHNDSDLLTAVTNFFIKNAKSIFPTTKWIALMEEHPSLCNELFMKFANAVKLL